jgi:hypothetical protein
MLNNVCKGLTIYYGELARKPTQVLQEAARLAKRTSTISAEEKPQQLEAGDAPRRAEEPTVLGQQQPACGAEPSAAQQLSSHALEPPFDGPEAGAAGEVSSAPVAANGNGAIREQHKPGCRLQ